MMLAQDIPVTICFNKTDLETEEKQREYRNIYEQAGYPVMFVSTYEKSGVEAVRDYLRGKTTILAGPSGVGKSSLTNLLQPEAAMETGSISEKDQAWKAYHPPCRAVLCGGGHVSHGYAGIFFYVSGRN